MKPLCIDLYAGLGGWTDGFLAEGYDVVGFDIERHRYPARDIGESGASKTMSGANSKGTTHMNFASESRLRSSPLTGGWSEYPGQLVIQDVLTLHGSQFAGAACIVASPPCQNYSWMAMPWSRAKREVAWQRWERSAPIWRGNFHLTDLFDACFRIQREASEAAGHHIPLVVENVKGAQPWVGPAKAHFGSFYLWGDVESVGGRVVVRPEFGAGIAAARRFKTVGHANIRDGFDHTRHLTNQRESEGVKQGGSGAAWFDTALDERRKAATATKNGGDWFASGADCSEQRRHGSGSNSRKAASAMIARIPLPLARFVARSFYPREQAIPDARTA
jgi:hypothetical protein